MLPLGAILNSKITQNHTKAQNVTKKTSEELVYGMSTETRKLAVFNLSWEQEQLWCLAALGTPTSALGHAELTDLGL